MLHERQVEDFFFRFRERGIRHHRCKDCSRNRNQRGVPALEARRRRSELRTLTIFFPLRLRVGRSPLESAVVVRIHEREPFGNGARGSASGSEPEGSKFEAWFPCQFVGVPIASIGPSAKRCRRVRLSPPTPKYKDRRKAIGGAMAFVSVPGTDVSPRPKRLRSRPPTG